MTIRGTLLLWITLLLVGSATVNAQPTPFDPSDASRAVARTFSQDEVAVSVDDLTMRSSWVFGLSVIPAPQDDHGEPWLVLFLARYIDNKWTIALESDPTFTTWLADAPADLLPADSAPRLLQIRQQAAISRGDGSALLSLPYAADETWTLTGGPHACCGSDTTAAGAIDFADGITTGTVRAAREGVVWRSANCPNFIRIDHPDGWQTGYYHVINEQVSNGQSVARGQRLATQGNGVGCGGFSTGPHLHFSLRFDGVPQSMNNRDVGGWTVLAGAAEYEGCMRRINDGLLQCVRGPIYNNGAIGSGDGTPLAPENVDLMTNGDFSGDFIGWDTEFSTTTNIGDEVLSWYGAVGELPGTILQVVNYTAPVGTVLELKLDMGNSSSVQKRVRVHVQSYDNDEGVWDDGLLVCEFIIPAGEILTTYTLRRRIETTWPQMRVWIEGYPGDGRAAILTDNVQLRRVTDVDPDGTECIDIPPNVPDPITRLSPPDDGIFTEFTTTQDVMWVDQEKALWYHVYFAGPDQYVFDQWFEGDEVCADAICTLPETPLLNNGEYDWWMTGWNEDGFGEYNMTEFTVAVDPPGLIQREVPTDFLNLTELAWTADPLATWYHVYLGRNGATMINQWHSTTNVCVDDVCSVEIPPLTNANYDWWMTGWGPGGMGEYDNVPFSVAEAPPQPIVMLSPSGSAPAGNLTLVWEADTQALWYRVYLVIPDAEDFDQWVSREEACADEQCSLDITMEPGAIAWWSVGWGPGGMGEWALRDLTITTP